MARLSPKYVKLIFRIGIFLFFSLKISVAVLFTSDHAKAGMDLCKQSADDMKKNGGDEDAFGKKSVDGMLDWFCENHTYKMEPVMENALSSVSNSICYAKCKKPLLFVLTPPPDEKITI